MPELLNSKFQCQGQIQAQKIYYQKPILAPNLLGGVENTHWLDSALGNFNIVQSIPFISAITLYDRKLICEKIHILFYHICTYYIIISFIFLETRYTNILPPADDHSINQSPEAQIRERLLSLNQVCTVNSDWILNRSNLILFYSFEICSVKQMVHDAKKRTHFSFPEVLSFSHILHIFHTRLLIV